MIPFKNRFHGHNSLKYVYSNGQAARSHSMVVKVVANKHRKDCRAAVVVSKKTLKSAVRRNRIRRRLYEVIRELLPSLDKAHDIVVIVTSSEVINLPSKDMSEQVSHLLNQALSTTKDNKPVLKKR